MTVDMPTRTMRITLAPEAGCLLACEPPPPAAYASNHPHYHDLLDCLYEAVLITTTAGYIVEVNKRASELLGLSEREMLQQSIGSVMPGIDQSVLEQLRQNACAGKHTLLEGHCALAARQGGFPAEISACALQCHGETHIGFFIRNIAKRKHVEDQLQQTMAALKRSNAELQQFAYVASHDLKEPLRMVTSYLGILQKRYQNQLSSEADEFIGYASDGARRMADLLEDLLQYARVQTHGNSFHLCDLNQCLQDCLANLTVAIAESNAAVEATFLPTVLGDASQLTRVLQNLIGNALKFHGSSPVRIRLRVSQQDDAWHIQVIDNGVGMEMHYAERIFQVFQRLHSRRSYAGSGIGLAICKRIIERHGGRIWLAAASLNHGCTFEFTLPVSNAALAA